MYILKFKPIVKERIWGGHELAKLGKKLPKSETPIGESWEISAVQGDLSVVANGMLKGNTIEELTEIYMGDLVGDKVYAKFGIEFPLLVKLLDVQDNLSIQVHPNDRLAAERHHSYGKTEMWYIIDHVPGAQLKLGFNQPVDRQKYDKYFEENQIEALLESYTVENGDSFLIPAGTIHSIGGGILLAEIQQTSDITYRIYDYDRTDTSGKKRELHTDLAIDAIEFGGRGEHRVSSDPQPGQLQKLTSCPYFETNIINIDKAVDRDYSLLDSFVIYICTEGSLTLASDSGETETIVKGETVLIPAAIDKVRIEGNGKILETYIP